MLDINPTAVLSQIGVYALVALIVAGIVAFLARRR
jgi:hypothetical protein